MGKPPLRQHATLATRGRNPPTVQPVAKPKPQGTGSARVTCADEASRSPGWRLCPCGTVSPPRCNRSNWRGQCTRHRISSVRLPRWPSLNHAAPITRRTGRSAGRFARRRADIPTQAETPLETPSTMTLTGHRAYTTCPRCGEANPVVFVVHDHVWESAGLSLEPQHRGGPGYWCLTCFERRLGREITPADLKTGPNLLANKLLRVVRD